MSIETELNKLTLAINALTATLNKEEPLKPHVPEPPQPEVVVAQPQASEDEMDWVAECRKLCIKIGKRDPNKPKTIIKNFGGGKLSEISDDELPKLFDALQSESINGS